MMPPIQKNTVATTSSTRANYPFDKRWRCSVRSTTLTDTLYAETVGMDGTQPTYSTGLPRTFVVGVQAKW